MHQIQTTQTAALADNATVRRLLAAMDAFMAADSIDEIAANVALQVAKRDANMKQAA